MSQLLKLARLEAPLIYKINHANLITLIYKVRPTVCALITDILQSRAYLNRSFTLQLYFTEISNILVTL